MSSLKTNAQTAKRVALNTTINEEVFNEFKVQCKEIGVPMNVIIESFMRQFSLGEFVLKMGRANRIDVDLVDDED